MKKIVTLLSSDGCPYAETVKVFLQDVCLRYGIEVSLYDDKQSTFLRYGDAVLSFSEDSVEMDFLAKEQKLWTKVYLLQQNKEKFLVQENCGGIPYGVKGIRKGLLGREAFEEDRLSEIEIERTGRVAFELAEKNGYPLRSIDQADREEVSKLWRRSMAQVWDDYPFVDCKDVLFDRFFETEKEENCVYVTTGRNGNLLKGYYRSKNHSVPYYYIGDDTFAYYGSVSGDLQSYLLAVCFLLEESFGISEGRVLRKRVSKLQKSEKNLANILSFVLQ